MIRAPSDGGDELRVVQRSVELLNATHDFPCSFMFKVIVRHEATVVQQIVQIVRDLQQLDDDPPFSTRYTPSGRHVAVTLEPLVRSADEVLIIYDRMRTVPGVVMLL